MLSGQSSMAPLYTTLSAGTKWMVVVTFSRELRCDQGIYERGRSRIAFMVFYRLVGALLAYESWLKVVSRQYHPLRPSWKVSIKWHHAALNWQHRRQSNVSVFGRTLTRPGSDKDWSLFPGFASKPYNTIRISQIIINQTKSWIPIFFGTPCIMSRNLAKSWLI